MIQLGAALAAGYFGGPMVVNAAIKSKTQGLSGIVSTVAPTFYGKEVAKAHADYDAITSIVVGAVAYYILGKVL